LRLFCGCVAGMMEIVEYCSTLLQLLFLREASGPFSFVTRFTE
jgi:hypothetical protein